ncbi:putative plastid-lipid-associated protein 11, chloroplastic [Drosera capensis]
MPILFALPSPPPSLNPTPKSQLLSLIADQHRGLATQRNPHHRSLIIESIHGLSELGKGTVTTGDGSLSGTWRMLWTTEKEQLYVIRNGPVFGTEAGDVLQVIDVKGRRLRNVITFPPHGAFVVGSEIEVVSDQRVNFRFTSAVLRGKGWRIPLPPFGQGCNNRWLQV